MKKVFGLGIAVLAVLAVPYMVSAHSGGVYKAKKVADTEIVIDGKFDEAPWKAAEVGTIDEAKVPSWQAYGTQVQANDPPDDSKDLSADFRVAYSDKYLYLAVNVNDDVFVSDDDTIPNRVDSLELYLDGLNNGSETNEEGITDMVKLAASTPSSPNGAVIGDWTDGEINDAKIFGTVSSTGYTIEAALPWAFLETGIGPHASIIGFDLQINDRDDPDGSSRETAMVWSGGEDKDWQNPSAFGDLVLLP